MEVIYYYHKNDLCSKIYVNGDNVSVENFTDFFLYKAFGENSNPTMEDLDELFKDRCFPESRPNKKEILKYLGLDFYEPREICFVTHGVILGDFFWLRWEDQDITWERDIVPRYKN